MTNPIAIIALALSLLTSVIAVTAVIVQMRTNVDRLNKKEDAQDKRDEASAKELTEFLVMLKTFMAEQSLINKTVSCAMTDVVEQLRDVQREHQSLTATVSVLSQSCPLLEGRVLDQIGDRVAKRLERG